MAKTKEELEALRARCAALAEELQGLTDEELELVAGGVRVDEHNIMLTTKLKRLICKVDVMRAAMR